MNSFQQWQDAEEQAFGVPDEIEFNLIKQVETFSFFGTVLELFVPNALSTAARLVGSDDANGMASHKRRKSPESAPGDWRSRPEKPSR